MGWKKLTRANLVFFPIYYLVNKLCGLCPSGLWVLETKTKTSETHNSFSLTPLSAAIFKSLFWYSKVEFWLLFLLLFSLVIFQRRRWGRRNILINISKYYLATPVISTGYLPYSLRLTSTLNALWNHGPSVLISLPCSSSSDNPYTLPFLGEAVIPPMSNFLRYTNKKEFLCLRKLWEPYILKLSPNITLFSHLQNWIQEHLDKEGKI